MDRRRRLTSGAVLIMVGLISISRFTTGVRSVVIVGLVGGGCALGVGFAALISSFIAQRTGDAVDD